MISIIVIIELIDRLLDALSFTVSFNIKDNLLEKSELLNKKIKDSNLPENIRIGAVVRKEKVVIPRSDFSFEKDDLVVFLAKREQLKEVEDIFRVTSV